MKLVIQRVTKASVEVENKIIGQIEKGFLVLLGVGPEDNYETADFLVEKLCNLRVFEDENQKMNLSVQDIKGEILVVSQFTLAGDTSRGNRPGFDSAAKPDVAKHLYEYFSEQLKTYDIKIQNGIFQADMQVELINDGPVTFMLEK